MECNVCLWPLSLALAVASFMTATPACAQIIAPCSASMISSFTPCLNLLTNSTDNGTSPSSDCCNSLMALASGGMNCLCLIVTGSFSFSIPINRTLAISLPRACSLPGAPLQCEAKGEPGPASVGVGPSPSTGFTPPPSPQASAVTEPISPAPAPQADSASSPTATASTGSRPVLTPSSAISSYSRQSCLSIVVVGLVLSKYIH